MRAGGRGPVPSDQHVRSAAMSCTSTTGAPGPAWSEASSTPAPSIVTMPGGYAARTMEGGFGGLFGGDPDEFQRRLGEAFEQLQAQQGLAWADNAINLAVQMTVAAVSRVNLQGNADAQAEQIRAARAPVSPGAVALVREARQGLQ